MTRKIEVTHVDIMELAASALNINDMDSRKMAALAESIRRSGFIDPIEVCPLNNSFPESALLGPKPWQEKYLIVDGHHRVEAARRAGVHSIPAIVRNYTPREAKARMLQTNTLRGKLDKRRTAKLVADIVIPDAELKVLAGMGTDDVKALRALAESGEMDAQSYASASTKWRSIRIDIPEDVWPFYCEAIDVARRRLAEAERRVPDAAVDALKAAIIDAIAAGGADNMLTLLWMALARMGDELEERVLLSGPPRIAFEEAIRRAQLLGETEHYGKCIEYISQDFLLGNPLEVPPG